MLAHALYNLTLILMSRSGAGHAATPPGAAQTELAWLATIALVALLAFVTRERQAYPGARRPHPDRLAS